MESHIALRPPRRAPPPYLHPNSLAIPHHLFNEHERRPTALPAAAAGEESAPSHLLVLHAGAYSHKVIGNLFPTPQLVVCVLYISFLSHGCSFDLAMHLVRWQGGWVWIMFCGTR